MTPAATDTPSRTRPSTRAATASERHLRLVPPPDTEPPQGPPTLALSVGAGTAAPAVQGTLALLFTLPGGVPAEPAPRRALHLAPRPRDEFDLDDYQDEPVQTPRSELPDPRRWSARLVQAAVEASQGDRPVAQLLRWTSRDVYERLSRQSAPLPTRSRPGRTRAIRPVLRSLHVSEPADGVVEACATVHDGVRGRAVAFRLEGLDGRWVCTALDLV